MSHDASPLRRQESATVKVEPIAVAVEDGEGASEVEAAAAPMEIDTSPAQPASGVMVTPRDSSAPSAGVTGSARDIPLPPLLGSVPSTASTAGVTEGRQGSDLGANKGALKPSLEALISPQLRAELRAAGVGDGGGILDEPDSDLDCGPEATDVEDE